DRSQSQILLEWSALLTASLTISTIPASYNFVLMVFPVCVLTAVLSENRQYRLAAVAIAAYLGIVFPLPVPGKPSGLSMLLYVPRLPLMMVVLFGMYALMWPKRANWDWSRYAWSAVMIVSVLLSVRSTFRLQQGERQEYAYRVPLRME